MSGGNWSTVYAYVGHSLALNLRQPNIVPWDSYMDGCISTLQKSEDAASSDGMLSKWALMQHGADEIVQRSLSKIVDLTAEANPGAIEALGAEAKAWEETHSQDEGGSCTCIVLHVPVGFFLLVFAHNRCSLPIHSLQ